MKALFYEFENLKEKMVGIQTQNRSADKSIFATKIFLAWKSNK